MFSSINARLRLWRLRHIAHTRLSSMSDRMLLDIGTERDAIEAFLDAAEQRALNRPQ